MNISNASKTVSNHINAGILTWNTGRLYSEAGQRIAAVVLPSTGQVAFMDVDRGIDGVTKNPLPGYSNIPALEKFVMDEYDHGRYNSGFYEAADIGNGFADTSGFMVKMKLAAKEQMKNEVVILHGAVQHDFDPTSVEGYALVMADPALQLDWQDRLDSFFGERIVDVRNALRDAGWEGEHRAISLRLGEVAVTFKPMQVGAGANVVGGIWKLLRATDQWMAIDEIADDLSKSSVELAADIGKAMQKATARICENRLRQPQELTLAEFSEIATVKKLVNHGRKWDVIFNAENSGFCDSPTREDALREAHSREINNAIYSHSPDAPDFMDKAVFPPENVLAEYPELRVKFADVFEARGVVGEGRFSGLVLDSVDGVVTQKINRDGGTVRHALGALSGPVVVGSVVDISYLDGVGVVADKGASLGSDLGR